MKLPLKRADLMISDQMVHLVLEARLLAEWYKRKTINYIFLKNAGNKGIYHMTMTKKDYDNCNFIQIP